MSQKKQAPTNVVPFYKFCFEQTSYIKYLHATTLSYYQLKLEFIWSHSFVITHSNVNLEERPILHLSVIELFVCNHPLNRNFTSLCQRLSLTQSLRNKPPERSASIERRRRKSLLEVKDKRSESFAGGARGFAKQNQVFEHTHLPLCRPGVSIQRNHYQKMN